MSEVPADRRLWTPEHRAVVRWATCVHEAGHAVANMRLDVDFGKIRILTDDSGYVDDVETDHLRDCAIIGAAGLAAELIWLVRTGHDELVDAAHAGAEYDTANLRLVCRRGRLDEGEVRTAAHRLTTENWAAVMRLGSLLRRASTVHSGRATRTARVTPLTVLPGGMRAL